MTCPLRKYLFARVLLLIGAAGTLVFVPVRVVAQEGPDAVETIETELGAEQIVVPEGRPERSMGEKLSELKFDERQLIQMNQNLKNVIEENQQLLNASRQMAEEIGELRGQSGINNNRIRVLTRQRDELREARQEAERRNRELQERIEALNEQLKQRAKEFESEIEKMEAQIQMEEEWKEEIEAVKASPGALDGGVDPLAFEKINEQNDILKREAAKVHYNLGNIYFQQGKYKEAADEYERAVVLAPYDAEAHYNLAFVSGEHLKDPRVALKHYQQYLYLKPNADDKDLVQEKILSARLTLRIEIDSPLDETDPSRDRQKSKK